MIITEARQPDPIDNERDLCVKPETEELKRKVRESKLEDAKMLVKLKAEIQEAQSEQVKLPASTKLESGLKDSGEREQYKSGMVRDTATDKPRFDLVIPVGIPYEDLMLTRWAELLRKGSIKYAERNWELADSDKELQRAKASAFRHFLQWFTDEEDEDHAAAVFFNINEVETIRVKQRQKNGESIAREDSNSESTGSR